MAEDSLGDRMKHFESLYSQQCMPCLPTLVRCDGRAFHSYTHGMYRPFDDNLSRLMCSVLKVLVRDTVATAGYTQSDEITLLYAGDKDLPFGGNVTKMTSLIASLATAAFNLGVYSHLPASWWERAEKWATDKMEKTCRLPTFDARVFQVPNEREAALNFLWREQDATRNSVQMAARSMYSHKECDGKDQAAMHDMLMAKGTNWNDYPPHFKRGIYVTPKELKGKLSVEDIDKLPALHHGRMNPDMDVVRRVIDVVDMPPISRISNREDVLFRGAEPVLFADSV